jgi:hypothetical protein
VATLSVSLEVFTLTRSGRGVQVAAGAVLRYKRNASQGCSRVRREIPSGPPERAEPGASRYPVSARIDSSFACLDSWHRAPLLAEEEARAGTRTEGVDALLVRMHVRNGCGSHPKNPKAKTSEWVAVTASRHFSREGAGKLACRRDSARERVRCRPYPGRQRACSASQVASL